MFLKNILNKMRHHSPIFKTATSILIIIMVGTAWAYILRLASINATPILIFVASLLYPVCVIAPAVLFLLDIWSGDPLF